MTVSKTAIAATLLLCLLALAACGGDESTTSGGSPRAETTAAADEVPAAVVAKANRNCEQMLKDVARVGHEAREAGYETARELTTMGFAEPGIKLVKDLARRQQALRDEADSSNFDAYAVSFDPIIVLGEQWLQAQKDLDLESVGQLQEILTSRGSEQQVLAERAGLARCNVDFLNELVRSASS
jgi:hypothetical protein